MNKKFIISAILAASLVTFSGIAYAADQNNSSPEWFKYMIEWKKDQVNEAVKNGNVTEEQGKQLNENIDAMVKFHQENGFGPGACGNNISKDGITQDFGPGMMKSFKGNENYGPGMMNNFINGTK